MAEPIWVAELHISRRVAEKLVRRHRVHESDVRTELVGVAGLRAAWFDNPKRGRRAITRVPIGGRRFVVILYPVPHPMGSVYRLGSAYPERRWR